MRLSTDGKTLLQVNPDDINQEGHFVVPLRVTTIARQALKNCVNLKTIDIHPKVTFISSYAFAGCTGLQSLNITEGITFIGSYAFKDCVNLQSVTIPKGVTQICNGSFQGCTNLKTVTLPEGIQFISQSTFENCSKLQIILIDSKNEIEVERITKLLPEALLEKIIPIEVAEKTFSIRSEQMSRLSKMPETNPLFRFFNQNAGRDLKDRTKVAEAQTCRTLPNNIFEAINPFSIDNSLYYQRAQKRILEVPLPKNKDALIDYQNKLTDIVNELVLKVKEFNPRVKQSTVEELSDFPVQSVLVCS